MGTRSHLADWPVLVSIFLFCDSSAALAAMKRKDSEGSGDMVQKRHWWLQGHVLELTIQQTCSRRLSPKDNCDVGANSGDNDGWMIPAEQFTKVDFMVLKRLEQLRTTGTT